jgi:hypothetical protein
MCVGDFQFCSTIPNPQILDKADNTMICFSYSETLDLAEKNLSGTVDAISRTPMTEMKNNKTPTTGRRHRLPAPGRQLVGRLDEEEPELGSGLRSHPPRGLGPHGVVSALRVRDWSLASEGYGAHDWLCHVFARYQC